MGSRNEKNFRAQINSTTIKIVTVFLSIVLFCMYLIVSFFQINTILTDAKNTINHTGKMINYDLCTYINNGINITSNLDILKILRSTYPNSLHEKVNSTILLSKYISMFDDNIHQKAKYAVYSNNNTLYSTQHLLKLSECKDYDFLIDSENTKKDILWADSDESHYIFYRKFDTGKQYQNYLCVKISKNSFDGYMNISAHKNYFLSLEKQKDIRKFYTFTLANGETIFCNLNNNLYAKIFLTNFLLMLLILINLIIIIVYVVQRSTNSLTKNIYYFLEKLENEQTIITTTDTSNGLYEEFTVIQRKIFELIQTIKQKNEKLIRIEDELNTLELELWQAKFNPHLLYNSLSVIKWNIIKNEELTNSTNLIDKLTSYYRMILNKNTLCIPLKDEIELLKQYVDIMKYAQSQDYVLEINVCTELLNYPIIKHSLQPLVENAVLHGLNQISNAKVNISGYKKDSRYYIEISDNGCGMPQSKVDEISSNNYTSIYKSYGIKNTRQRLLLYFGEETFTFKISSQLGMGTTITISWG